MHTYMHTYIHTYRHTHIHTYIHRCMHASIHPYITLHYFTLHYFTLHYIHYIHTYISDTHTRTHTHIYTFVYMPTSPLMCAILPDLLFYNVDLVSPGVVENLVRSSWLSHRGAHVRACTRFASKIQWKRLLGSAGDLWFKGVWSNLRGYKYAIYTSRWYVRIYVRIVVQGGDHSEKIICFFFLNGGVQGKIIYTKLLYFVWSPRWHL